MDQEMSEQRYKDFSQKLNELFAEMGKRLIGQQEVAEGLVLGLLCRKHVLLEGVPGLAKTTAVKALCEASNFDLSRVQFTPDMLPADIIGTQIYEPSRGEFKIKQGPVFANLVIADEINRAPAKVQAALLEAMQEHQVSIGEKTLTLPEPFMVMATQNPVEQEGTYPLPEAQVDRFMLKIHVDYPSFEQEKDIIRLKAKLHPEPVRQVIDSNFVKEAWELVDSVYVAEDLYDYILSLVHATRPGASYQRGDSQEQKNIAEIRSHIELGVSPRASIYLDLASRGFAVMNGRNYVTPSDVKSVAPKILAHRLMISYQAEASGVGAAELVGRLLETVSIAH